MSSNVGPGHPPAASRFRKGESGNPKGRPRSRSGRLPSAFDGVFDLTLTLMQDGKARAVTVEEALQQRTYQKAIAGDRACQREVLKWIAKREKYLADKAPKDAIKKVLVEKTDPTNANEALLLLGIAEPNTNYNSLYVISDIVLQRWAVQAALDRRGLGPLSESDVNEIKRCTRDAELLRWPRGIEQ